MVNGGKASGKASDQESSGLGTTIKNANERRKRNNRGDHRTSEDIERDADHVFKTTEALEATKTMEPTYDLSTVVKGVNDDTTFTDPGSSNNCAYCTIATEMRARGYDVSAIHSSEGTYSQTLYENLFGKMSRYTWAQQSYVNPFSEKNMAKLKNLLVRNAKGLGGNASLPARGCISMFSRSYYCGHIFNYSIDADGNVTFADGQDGSSGAEVEKYLTDVWTGRVDVTFTRLDNKPIKDLMKDYVREAY